MFVTDTSAWSPSSASAAIRWAGEHPLTAHRCTFPADRYWAKAGSIAPMRKILLCFLLLLSTRANAGPAPTIAIAYFDNNTGKADLDSLGRGLADMLITDLSAVPVVRVVEREKLNQVLAELKLSRTKFIDPKSALRIGKGLAAQYVMTGGYALAGEILRIDARVIRVTDGQVVAADKVEGSKEQFFALEKDLVDLLVVALDLKLGRADKAKLRGNATQSYEAFARYSAGLAAKDLGDGARARALFAEALAADPRYAAAKGAMERLDAIFAHAQQETLADADRALEKGSGLDPKAPDFAQRIEALLLGLSWQDKDQSERKTKLLMALGEKGLLACTKTAGPALGSPNVLTNNVPTGGVISHCRQASEVLLIAQEMTDDPTQWNTVARVCESLIKRLPEDKALLSYCQNTIVPHIRRMKANPDEQQVHQAPNMRAMLKSYAR